MPTCLTEQEGLDRLSLLSVRPCAFLPPPPWQTPNPPDSRPAKIPRLEDQGDGTSDVVSAIGASSASSSIVVSALEQMVDLLIVRLLQASPPTKKARILTLLTPSEAVEEALRQG